VLTVNTASTSRHCSGSKPVFTVLACVLCTCRVMYDVCGYPTSTYRPCWMLVTPAPPGGGLWLTSSFAFAVCVCMFSGNFLHQCCAACLSTCLLVTKRRWLDLLACDLWNVKHALVSKAVAIFLYFAEGLGHSQCVCISMVLLLSDVFELPSEN